MSGTGDIIFIGGAASFLLGSLFMGPIDLTRSVYNSVIGDSTGLKAELTSYVRRDIARKNATYTPQQVEQTLALELFYLGPFDERGVDSNKMNLHRLWDASESHARSLYQQFIWPSLTDQ